MNNIEIFVTRDGFKSHQTDPETNQLYVDLKSGDTVIVEGDSVYFKRKINLVLDGEQSKENLNLFINSLKAYLGL